MRFLPNLRVQLIAATALLAAVPAQAGDWYRAETNNFIIISEDTEEATREFASNLERFDMALRNLQALPVGEEQPTEATKLTVFRFGDPDAVARAAQIPGIAGVYFGRAGESLSLTPARDEQRRAGSVTNVNRSRAQQNNLDVVSVLQHEYVHYFMLQNFPAAYPRWYVEGYAELLATVRLNDDGSFHVGDPPQYRGDALYYLSDFRLEDMLDQDHDLTGRQAFQHYTSGWLLTHYLNFDPERLAQLNQYLAAIQQGEDSLTAARRIFGDLDAIGRELRSYRSGQLPGFDVRPPNYVAPTVEVSPISGSRIDLMMHEIRLTRGISKDDARGIASSLASHITRNPTDGHALALLARAQTAARQYAEAQSTAERLIALDARDIEGPLLASYAASERAWEDPSFADAAIGYAEDANRIDPADPRPKIAYYYAYVTARREAPEAAVIALEDAFSTAGSDVGYRLLLTRQLVSESRFTPAFQVFQQIAFRGHNQGDEEEGGDDADEPSFDKIMKFIQENNREAALAMIDDMLDTRDEDLEGNT